MLDNLTGEELLDLVEEIILAIAAHNTHSAHPPSRLYIGYNQLMRINLLINSAKQVDDPTDDIRLRICGLPVYIVNDVDHCKAY